MAGMLAVIGGITVLFLLLVGIVNIFEKITKKDNVSQ